MRRTHPRAAFVVKLIILFQTIMLWSILPFATFSDLESSHVSPHVVSIIRQTQEKLPDKETLAQGIRNWLPTHFSKHELEHPFFAYETSEIVIESVFGNLTAVDFPDLKYRTAKDIRDKLPNVFNQLPEDGFDSQFLNPCWFHENSAEYKSSIPEKSKFSASQKKRTASAHDDKILSCLPYVYLLGQPKSGTSDLYQRIVAHPDVVSPDRKEIRWFTRGEFTTSEMAPEEMLGTHTSLYSFTHHFDAAARKILQEGSLSNQIVTIDGGPHTLWWPTQSPDGALLPAEIPPPQIIREMQPNAKFLITLSDPVKRMYSDYYFLDDSLKPVENLKRDHKRGLRDQRIHEKSPEEFHERATLQVSRISELIDVTFFFFEFVHLFVGSAIQRMCRVRTNKQPTHRLVSCLADLCPRSKTIWNWGMGST